MIKKISLDKNKLKGTITIIILQLTKSKNKIEPIRVSPVFGIFQAPPCKVIHISMYKPSTNKPTIRIDKDRPARYKESGTNKERTTHLAKHIRLPNEISPWHTIG